MKRSWKMTFIAFVFSCLFLFAGGPGCTDSSGISSAKNNSSSTTTADGDGNGINGVQFKYGTGRVLCGYTQQTPTDLTLTCQGVVVDASGKEQIATSIAHGVVLHCHRKSCAVDRQIFCRNTQRWGCVRRELVPRWNIRKRKQYPSWYPISDIDVWINDGNNLHWRNIYHTLMC